MELISCPNCGHSNNSDKENCISCGSSISRYSSDGTLAPGTVIKNSYQVVRLIKTGGMGAVYIGEDMTGKTIAIKELFIDESYEESDEILIARFEREAGLLAKLSHPNLPRVSDYFYDFDNYFMIMDYIEGVDLEAILEKEGHPGLAEGKVIEWAIQICSVLDYLHNHKPVVIYRDIKPANIVIRRSDNMAILVDFGIARPVEHGLTTTAKTIIGTVGYSPPEQYEGKPRPQSDIYALGATMHHLLTGKFPVVPFEFEAVRKLNPSISVLTEQIVMKSLEFVIEDRYKSADELKTALLCVGKKQASPVSIKQKTRHKSEHKGKESADLAKAHSNLGVLYAKEGSYDRAMEEFEQAIILDPSSPEVYSNLGYVSLMVKDYDMALEYFNKAIELNPKLSGAYCNLGVLYNRKGMMEEAIKHFQKALTMDNSLAHAHINIAHIYGNRHMYKEMIEECEKAIRKKPECMEAYINYAYGCGKTGSYDKGIKRLEKAILFDSSSAFAHSNLGVLYGENKQYDKAIESFNKAISIEPDYAEAYSNMGIVYYKKGDFDKSRESFKKAVELNPEFMQAKANLARLCKEQKVNEKEKQEVLKLLATAPEKIVFTNEDLALSPNVLSPEDNDEEQGFVTFQDKKGEEDKKRRLEAQITVIPNEPAPYIELGRYYIDHGNMDEGIRHYQRAIRIEPSGIDGHFYLAQAYEKKGLNCLADTEYRKVIKNQPSHIEAYLHLGKLLLMKKDFESSSVNYSNLITIKNDIPEAHYGLGMSYMGLKKYKSAKTSLEKALEMGFTSSDLYFNLAMIYYEQEHLYDKAEEYLKIAISRNLTYPEAHLYLGNIYYRKKLLHEAMWQYEEVVQLKSDYAIAYSNLGAVYNDLNMLDKAEDYYYRALQLDRNIAEAHRNLGVLYQKKGEFLKAIDEMEIYLSLGEPEDSREIRKRIKDMEYKIKQSLRAGR